MASTLRTIFWGCIILVMVLAVSSVLAADFLRPKVKKMHEEGTFKEDCTRCVVAFDSVPQSMITFFQTLVMGDGIDVLMIPLIEEDWVAAAFLLILVATVYLGFSNLLLSVIVDKANEARTSDTFLQSLLHKKSRNMARQELMEMWRKSDADGDGIVTLEELRTTYDQQEEFRRYFRQMDIDLDFLEMAFEAAKNDDEECEFEDLANTVVHMKNTDIGPVVSVVKFQMTKVMKEMSSLSTQMKTLQADLQDQAEMTNDKFHRTEKTLRKSMTSSYLLSGTEHNPEHHHHSGAGGGLLPAAMVDMMSCFGSSPPEAAVVEKKLERAKSIHMDESDGENEDAWMSDAFGKRDKGNKLMSFTDGKEEKKRWSKDYRGGGDEGGGGRGRSKPKPGSSEEIMAAAAGGKELAKLQHQAQQIEGDLRNLKSKLASESGNRRAERREDVRVLTEILADIRAQEAQKKREISAAMGTARDVREDRPGRARDSRRRDSRKEMDFAA